MCYIAIFGGPSLEFLGDIVQELASFGSIVTIIDAFFFPHRFYCRKLLLSTITTILNFIRLHIRSLQGLYPLENILHLLSVLLLFQKHFVLGFLAALKFIEPSVSKLDLCLSLALLGYFVVVIAAFELFHFGFHELGLIHMLFKVLEIILF